MNSSDIQNGGKIPPSYSCEGRDVSPPLHWGDVPANAKSFVVLCQDPDAPGRTFYHWGAYNIGPGARQLNSGAAGSASLLQGINDFGVRGYRGPCPPQGARPHRYHFDVLALSVKEIGLEPAPSCRAIEEAARRHGIAQARLTGMFSR